MGRALLELYTELFEVHSRRCLCVGSQVLKPRWVCWCRVSVSTIEVERSQSREDLKGELVHLCLDRRFRCRLLRLRLPHELLRLKLCLAELLPLLADALHWIRSKAGRSKAK